MKRFAALFNAIDQSTKTTVKVAALADYFSAAPDDDRLWTIALFSGRRPKRAVTTTKLREWAAERAGIPLWLFEESYSIVGDLAETIALLWQGDGDQDVPLHEAVTLLSDTGKAGLPAASGSGSAGRIDHRRGTRRRPGHPGRGKTGPAGYGLDAARGDAA